MAIATYSDLRSAVADWLNRSDLTSVIPSFISLAEAGFNKDENLRLKPSIVRADATLDGQYEALPSDYLEMLNLQILASNPDHRKLQFLTMNQYDEYQASYTNNGLPLYYTIVGNQIRLLPNPDTSYTAEMVYYAKIPALSDSNTTNWLLTAHPDIYLYGTLIQSAPYLKDDSRTAIWADLYRKAVEDAHRADDRALFAGAVLKSRAKSF
jgi:hypothetical protein